MQYIFWTIKMISAHKYELIQISFFICTLFFKIARSTEDDEENVIAVKARGGFMSFADALSEFVDPKFENNDSVQGLLRLYRTFCPVYFGKYGDRHVTSRHVFVVIEGTHRITRNIVSTKLAEKLNAKHLYSPPPFMTRTKLVHNDTADMKRAFFMLGIYGTAHAVRDMVQQGPVVTAGYYVDQIAFSIAGAFQHQLPKKSSVIYEWPRDLLRPDIMFFVNNPSQLTKKRIDLDSFRGRIVQIYRNWSQPPPVIEVNQTNVYSSMVDLMYAEIRKRLGYDGSPAPASPSDHINNCFYEYIRTPTPDAR